MENEPTIMLGYQLFPKACKAFARFVAGRVLYRYLTAPPLHPLLLSTAPPLLLTIRVRLLFDAASSHYTIINHNYTDSKTSQILVVSP